MQERKSNLHLPPCIYLFPPKKGFRKNPTYKVVVRYKEKTFTKDCKTLEDAIKAKEIFEKERRDLSERLPLQTQIDNLQMQIDILTRKIKEILNVGHTEN